ncbi:MAG: hypothetical protein AAB731_01395 [Patescibacteria group bacterium]
MNQVAPRGKIYVCACCGKKSKDRYGYHEHDAGWDSSCMTHSILCYEKPGPDGNYRAVSDHLKLVP